MADEMLFWPGATLELPEDPNAAADELVSLLSRNDEMEQQRRSNVFHSLLHHDWRYRIVDLCSKFGLPVPQTLHDDLSRLKVVCDLYKPQ
jgi:hypothetical protein